jgi:D-beta-D-heptose 7-phosphate kinase / D-beta-D-heptose 1-phosphate adenosyltransferase
MQALIERIEQFGHPRVVVVGDFMLDRYVYGDVERINPEAPVPVLRKVRQESVVGGAGRVAAATVALGGTPLCVGIVGDDDGAAELKGLLAGAETDGLLARPDRPTAVKTRYVGLAQHRNAQQMFRVDEEATDPLNGDIAAKLLETVKQLAGKADILVLEDYGKGILTAETAPQFVAAAGEAGLRVLVDPACIEDYSLYKGVTLLTPNRYEAELASGIEIVDDASLEAAGRAILETTQADMLVITLDREGAFLIGADAPGEVFPHSHPRSVYDVSGAGDVVLAALAVGMASGCTPAEAVDLANVSAGLEVERSGFVPVTRQDVIDELHHLIGLREGKVVSREFLAGQVAVRRNRGEKVVFTNGCFDLLHAGHVRYLQQARQLGQCLIMAINSDDSVRRLKGEARPIIPESERAEMLAALECVDFVTIFDEDTPEALLKLLKPDVLAKGGTTPVVVGREIVEAAGGEVLTLDPVEGTSTTAIINRILDSTDA